MNARSTLVGLAASIVVLLGNDALAQDRSAETAFEALAKSYIEKLLEMEPERATWLGDHRFDNRLNDRTKEGVRRSSSAQLSTYYVGYMEMSDIRRDMEAKAKGRIELRPLHDAMLSFSAPAPKYVREMLGLAIDR